MYNITQGRHRCFYNR